MKLSPCFHGGPGPGTFALYLFPKRTGFMEIYHSSLCFPGFISTQTPLLSSKQLCKAKKNKYSEMEVPPKFTTFRGRNFVNIKKTS